MFYFTVQFLIYKWRDPDISVAVLILFITFL